MKETILTVRIDRKLKKELEALKKTKLGTTSDVVRLALLDYLQKRRNLTKSEEL